MAGGYREGSGKKPLPDALKKHIKTFCLDKDIIDWLDDQYPKQSAHELVRKLLRKQFDFETVSS